MQRMKNSQIRQKPSSHAQTGSAGELAVCRYLRGMGYRILSRNWRRPWGEIDIVVEREGVIHFVEVKSATRREKGFEPFLRADGWKMHKVRRTAETWLAANQYDPDTEWQMDIASVILETNLPDPDIEIIENI